MEHTGKEYRILLLRRKWSVDGASSDDVAWRHAGSGNT